MEKYLRLCVLDLFRLSRSLNQLSQKGLTVPTDFGLWVYSGFRVLLTTSSKGQGYWQQIGFHFALVSRVRVSTVLLVQEEQNYLITVVNFT